LHTFVFSMPSSPPISLHLPYTTLFRSHFSDRFFCHILILSNGYALAASQAIFFDNYWEIKILQTSNTSFSASESFVASSWNVVFAHEAQGVIFGAFQLCRSLIRAKNLLSSFFKFVGNPSTKDIFWTNKCPIDIMAFGIFS